MTRSTKAVAALAAASLLVASPVLAQTDGGAGGSTPGVSSEATPYTEEKLDSFVAAAKSVEEIVDEYQPKLDAAGSEDERRTIAEEANEQMRTAVEETDGITIPEYTEIARAAQRDEVLRQAISERMQRADPGEG